MHFHVTDMNFQIQDMRTKNFQFQNIREIQVTARNIHDTNMLYNLPINMM